MTTNRVNNYKKIKQEYPHLITDPNDKRKLIKIIKNLPDDYTYNQTLEILQMHGGMRNFVQASRRAVKNGSNEIIYRKSIY